MTGFFKRMYVMCARTVVGIGKVCTVLNLSLLIFSMFNTEYKYLNAEQTVFPISQAILTSLAIEKLIHLFYSKLGTKVAMPEQEE